ncbi:hypothetical protein E9840_03465 [Tissierella creatinini]|nr:hypothetical protein E9840_03465 [Tissierella creatinini]TJX63241.1 hypothetical protein E8P77_15425 [Soehngenia saccharolytica]
MEDIFLENIKYEFPERAIDITETLQLLKEVIGSTVDDISLKLNKAISARDALKMDKYKTLAEDCFKYEKLLEEIIDSLEIEIQDDLSNGEETEYNSINGRGNIPNYADFHVDINIEHSLYEDFMYIRPFGFKFIKKEIIESRTWSDLFVKTCEMLYDVEPLKFKGFENLQRMNGKKKKYFSKEESQLRKAIKIRDNIYVETNHSANTLRNIIVKMLKEYNYKVSDYKVYFYADYTELYRK